MRNASSTKAQFTRGQNAVLIACLVAGALAVGWLASHWDKDRQRTLKAEQDYIVQNDCVVAAMEGRFVSQYRCSLPEKRHLSSRALSKEALAAADKASNAAR